MWKTLCTNRPRQLLALAAATILLGTGIAWMQLVVIALGAVAGWFLFRGDQTGLNEGPDRIESSTEKSSAQQSSAQQSSAQQGSAQLGRVSGAVCLILFFVLLLGLPLVAKIQPGQPLEAFTAMYRSGSLVFGGGHVVLPLLSQEVVEPGWVGARRISCRLWSGSGSARAAVRFLRLSWFLD